MTMLPRKDVKELPRRSAEGLSVVPAAREHRHRWAFMLLALIGALIWIAQIALHIYGWLTGKLYEIDHTVTILGGLFGFVGFYGLDPRRARDGGAFIVEQGVKVIGALPRFGRRSTDAVAVPAAAPVVPSIPVENPDAGSAAPAEEEPQG